MAPQFVRANIRAMAGYTPGEQPSIGERVVKLNTNENPFPPSEKVMQAISQHKVTNAVLGKPAGFLERRAMNRVREERKEQPSKPAGDYGHNKGDCGPAI